MRLTAFIALGLLLPPAALGAQGKVPPPQVSAFAPDPLFVAPYVPGTGYHQIHMVPYPGQPGRFIVGLTADSLPAANGGTGSGMDLLTGVFDAVQKTFTPDLFAAALNSSGTEFGLMLLHDGLLAVFESNGLVPSSQNEVMLASRPNLNSPFAVLGPIGNAPRANSQSYWDPSLAMVEGKLRLLYVLNNASGGGDIAMADLNLAARTIGTGIPIILTPVASYTANSPTPIVDSNGDLIGVSHHVVDNATSDNDHYMSFDLDPLTPAVLFIDTASWINNGGFAGGTFYDGEYLPSPYHIMALESAWWTGGRAALGGRMEVTVNAPIQGPGAIPWLSFFMLSRGFLANPLPLSGMTGSFGLDPSFLLTATVGTHNMSTGRATVTLAVPNDPLFKGLVLPGQSCTINPKGAGGVPQVILGNTAALTIL